MDDREAAPTKFEKADSIRMITNPSQSIQAISAYNYAPPQVSSSREARSLFAPRPAGIGDLMPIIINRSRGSVLARKLP